MSSDPEICDVCSYPVGWDLHDDCNGAATRPTLPPAPPLEHGDPAVAIPEESSP